MQHLGYHQNCDECGEKITSSRYGAKYCSNAHRQKAYRKRVKAAKDAKAAKRRKSAKKSAATRKRNKKAK